MATLREVRNRISGVKKTQKITKAMKMVAAAKLRRAQRGVVSARPYAVKMRELLTHLGAREEALANPFFAPRPVQSVALVIVTSDRGFCGGFNSNLVKAAVNHIDTSYGEKKKAGHVTLFCVGKKGLDFFSKRGYAIRQKYLGVFNKLAFGQAQTIAADVINGYVNGDYDRVDMIYNEFKSMTQQRVVVDQFLPIVAEPTSGGGKGGAPADYIYEPSSAAILQALVPRHLNFQIWRILLESNAAEEGARMAAMENATTNANELIETLQLQYNKARQAAITKELLEVVSGAEALTQEE
jgi:F-type H+-transporting ATPase subunit gamma